MGEVYLVVQPAGAAAPSVVVSLNWFEEVKRLVPAN
jgi:hypothetical protein